MNWYFPNNEEGEETGLNDSGIAQFRSEGSLAREVIQNSLDASNGAWPVRVVFNRRVLPTQSVPGWTDLGRVMRLCQETLIGSCRTEEERLQNGKLFFEKALAILRHTHVPVLTISDYDTKGLEGDEADKMSPWYRLLRKQGTAAQHGNTGGTFGIGQRAPFAFSDLRTVFYCSKSSDRFAFLGKSILCSFWDPDAHVTRRHVGYLGVPNNNSRAAAIVDPDSLPAEFQRHEQGLDLHVMGYGDDDDWAERRSREIVVSFFAAIDAGLLEVEFQNQGRVLDKLNRETLTDRIASLNPDGADDTLSATTFYVEALRHPLNGQPFEKDLPSLGRARLYVSRAQGAPSKVAYMRRPKILVYDRTKNLLDNYAAVFICDNDRGNQKLAKVEDPTHTKWTRENGGKALLNEIQGFVTEVLNQIASEEVGAEDDVPDLGRYLPDDLPLDDRNSSEEAEGNGAGGTEGQGVVQVAVAPIAPTMPTRIRIPDPSDIEEEGGAAEGGSGEEGGGGEGPGVGPGTGGTGDRTGQARRVRSRTYFDAAGSLILAVSAEETGLYSVGLRALGEEGSYSVNILNAFDASTGEAAAVMNGRISGAKLESRQRRFKVTVEAHSRLFLDVVVKHA